MKIRDAKPDDREELSLADRAYSHLRRDVLDGVFDAGQPLRLEALKLRYGFSFTPLREALSRLAADNLVVLSSLRGFRVAPVSLDEMWDLISTRILIESEALRRSIERGDDDWESEIISTFHALSLSAARDGRGASSADALENRHAAFHNALIAGCGSPTLRRIASKLYVQSERYRRPTLLPEGYGRTTPRDVMREHKVIMTAAVGRCADEAVAALSAHYQRTGKMIEAALAPKIVAMPKSKRRTAPHRGAAGEVLRRSR